MSKDNIKHWGEWIEARADMLGYRRKYDLAERIGCSRQQLSRWLKMVDPPRRVLKGLDQSLCRALDVHPHTLFTTWKNHDPHKLPRANAGPDEYEKYRQLGDEKAAREMISSLASTASYDTLMKVVGILLNERDAEPKGDTKAP